MAELMRAFDFEITRYWDSVEKKKAEWLEKNDVPTDLLTGWLEDRPSLWRLDESPKKPTPEEILVAVAFAKGTKGNWKGFDFLIFDEEAVNRAELELHDSNGKTGVSRVDMSKLHCDLLGLSARKLCDLLLAIIAIGFRTGRYTSKQAAEFWRRLCDVSVRNRAVAETAAASVASAQPDAPSGTTVSPRQVHSDSIEVEQPARSAPTEVGPADSGTELREGREN